MKFALVNDIKTEATKGVKGICPGCASELIARCGEQKIHHWSHKGYRNCDPWWEPETAWHRAWKNKFPKDWQEISLRDEKNAEKHIADIRTGHNLVIEFQHSPIDPKERLARETFYKNMVWVVDGTRLKGDYPRFLKVSKDFQFIENGVYRVNSPEESFPSAWLDSSVPVLFDFLSIESISGLNSTRSILYCLFPVKIGGSVVIAGISRSDFVNIVIDGGWFVWTKNFISNLIQLKKEQQDQINKVHRHRENMNFQNIMRGNKNPRNRRF